MRNTTKTGLITITAIVTAILTSLFWIIAYNIALPASSTRGGGKAVLTETTEPDDDPQLVLGPGGMVVPVAGKSMADLADTYTQSRGGGARVHNAIDIMADRGTPVLAAAEGTVEKMFFSEGGGGITVYVRSPDNSWIHYYAHLDAYAPGLREGQKVKAGDRLGTVGITGNASPDGPHLHFAVHRMAPGEDWHEGTPVNPYPLLAGNQARR